jgi:4-carboxymuconolactone decarboxylase
MRTIKLLFLILFFSNIFVEGSAQPATQTHQLDRKQRSIIIISALTAKGDSTGLNKALHIGLDSGLTINQIKELLVHLYAYCGFPRSIRGLQRFMQVIEERKAKGINDQQGAIAAMINSDLNKYERGKRILEELTKMSQNVPLTGYSAFAPIIDSFLKEHLFADIFERDILSYAERELVTVSVLSTIGDVEPMLRSHLLISLNMGLHAQQLNSLMEIIGSTIGESEADHANAVLKEVLNTRQVKN